MKALFIPLKRKFYDAFANGSKTEELRLYGKRWNSKTCKVGREVVISKGYGKQARMTGKISFFVKIHGSTLSAENKDAVKEIYGTLDVLIALIGIEDLTTKSL